VPASVGYNLRDQEGWRQGRPNLREDPRVVGDLKDAVVVAIPLLIDSGRPVKANLSIDAALLEAIDEAARKRGITRSAFLAAAAREKIAQHR
jgi:hypothetical protein